VKCVLQVERHLRKLDQEVAKFKMELEADNAGITEILEKSVYHDLLATYMCYCSLVMAALCNRADHYIFILFLLLLLLLSSFFPRLISAVRDWMFTILWHMVWP